MVRGLLVGIVLILAMGQGTVRAQDLVDRYREARVRRIAREQAERRGVRMPLLPPEPVEVPGDTIRAWILSFIVPSEPEGPEPPPPIVVDSVRVIRKLERPIFEERFEAENWAFFQGHAFAELDTTRTFELRARLEHLFGPPTRTLAEMDSVESRPRHEIIQFEYWIVVNDTIPVIVMDANGFLDRGLVVATSSRWRERLPEIRRALLGPIESPAVRAAYVDYYYQPETRTWYVSGFDGASFFTRRIVRPDMTLGRPYVGTYAPPDTGR